jgi:hypothetical protein
LLTLAQRKTGRLSAGSVTRFFRNFGGRAITATFKVSFCYQGIALRTNSFLGWQLVYTTIPILAETIGQNLVNHGRIHSLTKARQAPSEKFGSKEGRRRWT